MIKRGPVTIEFTKNVREDLTFTHKTREEREQKVTVEEEYMIFPSGIELTILDEDDTTKNSLSKELLPGRFSSEEGFPTTVNREYFIYKTKISMRRFMPPYGATTFNIFGTKVSELCISTACYFDMTEREQMFSETRIFINGSCADVPNPQLHSMGKIHWGLGVMPTGPTEMEYHGKVRKQIIDVLTANLDS